MTQADNTASLQPPLTLVLFQPDIPQNTGTILRMAACLALPVGIIEPAGFPVSDRAFRRAGMDYLDQVEVVRHRSWSAFLAVIEERGQRLILATTHAPTMLPTFEFQRGDVLLFGRESLGVPPEVHARANCRISIPMTSAARSLNIAVAAAMMAGEALRQLGAYPTRAI